MPAARCPVCGEPLPKAARDRRVSFSGVVVCGNAECESRADDGCRFSGCDRPVYARRLCRGHYAQTMRGSVLHPLRDPDASARVAVAVRVSPECADRVSDDREGAREALERWARR